MEKPLSLTETADERRRRRLDELIELEGGHKRAGGKKPGHYVIAERVYEHENSIEDSTQMAQALRQVSQGKRNLGHATARRIEGAYQAQGLYGITHGWFDQPTIGTLAPSAHESDDDEDDDEINDGRSGIRGVLVGLALSLPSKYAHGLVRSMDLPFSEVVVQFAYLSDKLAMVPVIWTNPPVIESEKYYTRLYPLSVYRAIVRLASWRTKDLKITKPRRCIVCVIGGESIPRNSPMDVYYQAAALRVDLHHFKDVADLAASIQKWDPDPKYS
jgi:hypothetical protein